MRKENIITKKKKCFSSVSCFLLPKSLKRVQNTIYEEKEHHYQKHVLNVLQLVRQQNAKMHAKRLLSGKGTTLSETFYLSVFEHIRLQTIKKKAWKTLCGKKKKTLSRTYTFIVFQLLTYQNAKKSPKHPFMEKQKTLEKKTCILSVFERVRYINAKIYTNYNILGNETIITENLS